MLLLAACGKDTVVQNISEGPQTIYGVLRAAPIALDRRGTHILSGSGSDIAYVESPTLHLRQYEGRTVTIRGIVQKNIDEAFLPVLVAEDIVVHDPQYRTVQSSALGVRFQLPELWSQSGSGQRLTFRLPGENNDVLIITKEPTDLLPAGTPMVVASKRAMRVEGPGSHQTVHLPVGDAIVVFTLTPPGDAALAAEATASFLHMLNTVVITAQQQSGSGTGLPSSGSGSALSCGGPAGLLCPSGYYCAVTDRTNNIGICAQIRKR